MRALQIAIVLLLTGCVGADPSTGIIKDQIQSQLPNARFEHDSRIALGGIALWAAKRIVSMIDEADAEAGVYLRSINRVVVDTYLVDGLDEDAASIAMPAALENKLSQEGWQLAVRTQEPGENTWVLLDQVNEERIDGMYVVTLDRHELNIVYLKGRIDAILAEALADEPGLLADAF